MLFVVECELVEYLVYLDGLGAVRGHDEAVGGGAVADHLRALTVVSQQHGHLQAQQLITITTENLSQNSSFDLLVLAL